MLWTVSWWRMERMKENSSSGNAAAYDQRCPLSCFASKRCTISNGPLTSKGHQLWSRATPKKYLISSRGRFKSSVSPFALYNWNEHNGAKLSHHSSIHDSFINDCRSRDTSGYWPPPLHEWRRCLFLFQYRWNRVSIWLRSERDAHGDSLGCSMIGKNLRIQYQCIADSRDFPWTNAGEVGLFSRYEYFLQPSYMTSEKKRLLFWSFLIHVHRIGKSYVRVF